MTSPLVPIPFTVTCPFQQVSYDLITDLPIFSGFDSILVVVDHGLTKGVIFSLTMKTASALDIAKIFFNRVYSRFGLYDKIICDRGSQFAFLFAKELGKLLEYSLSLSTAYHPQTDGETECINQKLEVYLQIFCQNYPVLGLTASPPSNSQTITAPILSPTYPHSTSCMTMSLDLSPPSFPKPLFLRSTITSKNSQKPEKKQSPCMILHAKQWKIGTPASSFYLPKKIKCG